MTATTSPSHVRDAMQAIVRAHDLLRDFHSELVAFYEVVDDLLAEADPPSLEPVDPTNIVREATYRLRASAEWVPRWFGRFYRETALLPDDENDEALVTYEQLRTAFVFVAAAARDDELVDFEAPECVFGVAHVGRDAKVKAFIDAARYGIWNLDLRKLVGRDWVTGKTPEKVGKFGTGGFWTARRLPLVELASETEIRELVTEPLKTKYREAFG